MTSMSPDIYYPVMNYEEFEHLVMTLGSQANGETLKLSDFEKTINNELNSLRDLRSLNVVRLYDHYRRGVTLPAGLIQKCLWKDSIQSVAIFSLEKFGTSLVTLFQNTQSQGPHSHFHELYANMNGMIYPRPIIYAMIKDLLNGLSHMHEARLLHRDLRPHNLLVCHDNNTADGVRLKICDFGLSRALKGDSDIGHAPSSLALNCRGTHPFQPPEVVCPSYSIDRLSMYSVQSDIFSAALCVYFLLSNGGHPLLYSGSNRAEFSNKGHPTLKLTGDDDVKMRNWFFYYPQVSEASVVAQIIGKVVSSRLTYGRGLGVDGAYYLEGIRHLPESFDLVYRMMGRNGCVKDDRLSLDKCKENCIFWTYPLQLDFIELIANILKHNQPLRENLHCVEEMAIYLPSPSSPSSSPSSSDQTVWNWERSDDPMWRGFFFDFTYHYSLKFPETRKYDTTQLFDLLILIRNVKCHLHDKYAYKLKKYLGTLSADSLARFIFDRFPGLIPYLLQITPLMSTPDVANDSFWARVRMGY
jgi:serine/threonine protein kinase